MKLLDRYVARQLLITSVFGVAILSIVLVLGKIFKELLDLLVNHNVPLDFILSFIAYILPFSLAFTIPWGFLTAVLLVFGKMSAENELVALRSSGVSIPRICVSVFVLALVFVGICLWINVDVAPRAQASMKDTLYRIATNNPLAMFSSDKVIEEFPGKKIYIERNDGPELHNILVYEMNDESYPMRVVYARRGVLRPDPEKNQLLLHLSDVRYEERDADDPTNAAKIAQGIVAQETPFPISLTELYEKNKKKKGLSTMTVDELLHRPKPERATGLTKAEKKQQAAEVSAAKTEVNKRFSYSLASFAFALIGVPLAITAHRRETSAGFMLSLAVALVYFLFIIIADALRENPKLHPELLIWMPNVLFIGLGLWMFVGLSRK
ncbi:MAG TPA: LptF/LptG family permease [Chthoniobacteraceae bacterium]|nr:LptF/LptG family permease [Chthoniobacteraceae bacterium]